ncbi:MAG: hypothetical protein IPP29_08110 [Bacteroidetes bacterium]|nr:hypothetical protein [Bacteroidota bacterium]
MMASINEKIDSIKEVNIDAARIINNGIIPIEILETNSRSVNEFEIQYREQGVQAIINSYNDLFSIANQCPFSGGEAVIKARILLSLVQGYNFCMMMLQAACNKGYIEVQLILPRTQVM